MSMGGNLGGGGFFGSGGGAGGYGPQGQFGAWPSCGCSSLFIIMAGVLLVMGGCMRMFGQ
jgi:hypothetical protein